jgi:RimJ/RimL family protein N-acetyltransferase
LTFKQAKDYFFNDVKKDNSNIFVHRIRLIDTNEIIGTIELRENETSNKNAWVCRFLIGEENFKDKGIGTQALKEILRIGFEDFKFEKILLRVFDFNHRAIKCYENAGFLKEKLIENARKATIGYWNLYEIPVSRIR